MMLTFIEHLNGVYAACNEHLLEQGRKRDQVIAFYIVLLAFMITSGRQLAQMTNQIIVHSGLIVIGAICIRTIADLRSWHTQYLDCMKIINWGLAHREQFSSVEQLRLRLQMLTEMAPEKRYSAFRISTDNGIYFAMVLLSGLPVVLLTNDFHAPLAIMVIIVCLYLIGAIYWSARYLTNKINQGLAYRTWILDFDYNAAAHFENKYFAVFPKATVPIIQLTGGVITIPYFQDKLVMIEIKRHGQRVIEFPRGFVEPDDLDHCAAAQRELIEELGLPATAVSNLKLIGDTDPVPELLQTKIKVVQATLTQLPQRLQVDEGVYRYRLVTPETFWLLANSIDDGFTLAAWTLHEALADHILISHLTAPHSSQVNSPKLSATGRSPEVPTTSKSIALQANSKNTDSDDYTTVAHTQDYDIQINSQDYLHLQKRGPANILYIPIHHETLLIKGSADNYYFYRSHGLQPDSTQFSREFSKLLGVAQKHIYPPIPLRSIAPDSNLITGNTKVVVVHLGVLPTTNEFTSISTRQLTDLVKNGKIRDGFTLAAITRLAAALWS